MSIAPAARNPGPDVVRALAILGVVVMNYHGYLINRGAQRDGSPTFLYDLFDPWVGPLATRFAATFVLTAPVELGTEPAEGADGLGLGVAECVRSSVDGLVWRGDRIHRGPSWHDPPMGGWVP